jgi:hypothetical protein
MLLDTHARFGTGRTSTYARDTGSDKDSRQSPTQTKGPIRAWIGPKLAILVPHTGFEPVISALRGRCPRPLDECGAGRRAGTATTADRIPKDSSPVARAQVYRGRITYSSSTPTVGRPLVPSVWIRRVWVPLDRFLANTMSRAAKLDRYVSTVATRLPSR